MRIKINFDQILMNLITLLTVLISGTAVYSIEQFASLRLVTLVLLIILLGYSAIKKNCFNKKKFVIFVFFTILFFAINILNAPNEIVGLVSKCLLFILFVNYCMYKDNIEKIFMIIYKIVMICSISSLVLFIALYVLKISLPFFYVDNGFYKSYFYLLFTSSGYAEQIGSFSFYRLQSIFWEPGVFSVYILIALFYYYFLSKERDVRQLFVLLFCLILTTSTTGLIVGIGLFIVTILYRLKSKTVKAALIVPMIIGALPVVNYLWLEKKNSAISPSYSLRMYDMQRSIEIWKDNFILGVGYNNNSIFAAEGRSGNSNGFLNWCMATGTVGLLFIIVPFIINCIRSKGKERLLFSVYLGIFVLINFTEPLTSTPIMILLISFSYAAMLMKRGFVYNER